MVKMVKLIQNLEENLPKGDDVTQGTHEDKDSVHVDRPFVNKDTLRGFDSNM